MYVGLHKGNRRLLYRLARETVCIQKGCRKGERNLEKFPHSLWFLPMQVVGKK